MLCLIDLVTGFGPPATAGGAFSSRGAANVARAPNVVLENDALRSVLFATSSSNTGAPEASIVSSWYDSGVRLPSQENAAPTVESWYDSGMRLPSQQKAAPTVESWYDSGMRLPSQEKAKAEMAAAKAAAERAAKRAAQEAERAAKRAVQEAERKAEKERKAAEAAAAVAAEEARRAALTPAQREAEDRAIAEKKAAEAAKKKEALDKTLNFFGDAFLFVSAAATTVVDGATQAAKDATARREAQEKENLLAALTPLAGETASASLLAFDVRSLETKVARAKQRKARANSMRAAVAA